MTSARIVNLVLLYGLMLAIAPWSVAQQAGPQLMGRVVRADNGAPIAGAKVILAPPLLPSLVPTTTTNTNGEYSFAGVPEGNGPYMLSAEADGFVPMCYGNCDLESGVRMTETTRLRGYDFKMVGEAVIRGTVVTPDGKAVGKNIGVVAVPSPNSEMLSSQTWTDEKGQFALRSLPAGSYFVRVKGKGFSEKNMSGLEYSGVMNANNGYETGWYGSPLSAEEAIAIPLKTGETRDGVRVTVRPVKGYKVIIHPVAVKGGPQMEYRGELQGWVNPAAEKQPDGSYLIRDVSPGHYRLDNYASWPDHLRSWWTEFDVEDADVTLHAYMSGIGSVEGVAQWNEALMTPTSENPRRIRYLYLESTDGATMGLQQRIANTDRSFKFLNLTPGSYFFWAGQTSSVHAVCGGMVVNVDHPLHISERQQVKGCTVVVGDDSIEKPSPISSTHFPGNGIIGNYLAPMFKLTHSRRCWNLVKSFGKAQYLDIC